MDARDLTPAAVPIPPSLVVCDASFIGLAKVLPAALALAAPGAQLVALVKPQFEVGPAQVGKGGIVRDPAVHLEVLTTVSASLREAGLEPEGVGPSPLRGADGNVEFVLHARAHPSNPVPASDPGWAAAIAAALDEAHPAGAAESPEAESPAAEAGA